MIETILLFIVIAWIASILISVIIVIIEDEDIEVESRVVFLFPANLIFVIKYWWGAIVKAIKS